MAKPIAETPILKGKDSKRFSNIIKDNESKKASPEEYKRVMDNYNKLKSKLRLD